MTKSKYHTLTVFLACWSNASPCCLKILTLAFSRSFLSIPSRRGIAPTRIATSMSLNAALMSDVGVTSAPADRTTSQHATVRKNTAFASAMTLLARWLKRQQAKWHKCTSCTILAQESKANRLTSFTGGLLLSIVPALTSVHVKSTQAPISRQKEWNWR